MTADDIARQRAAFDQGKQVAAARRRDV